MVITFLLGDYNTEKLRRCKYDRSKSSRNGTTMGER